MSFKECGSRAVNIPSTLYTLLQMMTLFALCSSSRCTLLSKFDGQVRNNYPAAHYGCLCRVAALERLLVFTVAWEILVYYPLVHRIWGGGFLHTLGVLDFALMRYAPPHLLAESAY